MQERTHSNRTTQDCKYRLTVVPLTLSVANEYVRLYHRHRGPVVGHRFSIGLADKRGSIRAVAIVGRPVARRLDQSFTCEVLRLVSDGSSNACSMLYGSAARIAREMGFRRCITYTTVDETGVSLIAAGWKVTGRTKAASWNTPARPRDDHYPLVEKLRWEPRWSSEAYVKELTDPPCSM